MSTASRFSAFLAYLLPILGWLYVYIARRNDKLAVYHTQQSIALFVVAVGLLLVWVVLGWAVSLIPYLGFILAVATFALVILFLITLFVNWLVGMVFAWQAKLKPLPVTGNLVASFQGEAVSPQPVTYQEVVAQAPAYAEEVPSYAGEVTVRVIGFGFRLVAAVIDVLILGFTTVALALTLSFLSWLYGAFQPSADILFTNLFIVLGVIVSVVYYVGFWAKSGQTIGKSVLGIKVISADGSRVTWGQAFLRYIGYIVSGLIFSIGFLWAAFDQRRQGWHDKIAKTYVVDEDDGFSSESTVAIDHVELGRNWYWLALWVIIGLITPFGSLSGLLILGPFIDRFVTNLFQGLQ